MYFFICRQCHGGKREGEKDSVYIPRGFAARHTLASLATARGVNLVWIKILGRLTHIVLFATVVTTRLLHKSTHQRTASASGQQFARPTLDNIGAV